jgi:4-hydroxy-3-methylbut-2-enyl diphosphate reductase
MLSKRMKLHVIEPHGFCSGVKNAVKTAKSTLLSSPGERVYCLHELVHNEIVINELNSLGMITVDTIDEIPDGSRVLFSAHGVSPQVREIAERKNLTVIDTTCPFVSRVHREALSAAIEGKNVIVIGESKHVEVQGVVGEIIKVGGTYIVVKTIDDVSSINWDKNTDIRIVVQTTLSEDDVVTVIEAIKNKFPNTETSMASSVCTATHDRQKAVRDFVADSLNNGAKKVGVLVLGSVKSANTNRLLQIAQEAGAKAWRCASEEEIKNIDFSDIDILGVTAGASTPESLFNATSDI